MKKNVHPPYQPVVLCGRSAGVSFLTRSKMTSTQEIEWEGGTYPLVDVDVSSASHPFWTGRGRVLDTAGRVERFQQRYGRRR
ncbi:MAG: type B 50S ribosomal protein L31 [Ornithinimicrobium sp.]